MRNNFDQQSGKMEGRLTQEQITAFRQIFSRYMDGEVGGLKLDHFSPAVLECLRQTSNSAAPSERDLEEQFTRLSGGSGLVRWPQFFQVIIHLQSVAGATGGAEAIDLEPSAPPIPDPQRAVPSLDGSAAGGGGVSRSGTVRRGRIEPQGVQRRGRRPKRTKLQRQSTLIRREVETLPTFWPIFTILVTLAQLVVMVTLLALMGFAPINYQSIEHMEEFKSLNITGGNRTELVTYYRSSNLWIGPTPRVLVEVGAKFSPCMRNDFHIRRRNAEARDDFEQKNFGCCRNSENIGTTVTSQCGVINGNAPPDVESLDDFAFIPQTLCSNASVVPNFHPCCISLTGRCEVMNIFQCDARNGIFHEELDSCFEVNCLEDICGFRGAYVSSDENMIYSANQFWRWFLAIFTHLGIIHFILVMAIQLYAGIKIERTIGWLRITLIYVISGVGGNILSAVFAPYEVNAGASGAVFGLLGVLYVELFQFWQIKDRAWLELIVLTAFVLLLLGVGTLPYVDNWAHIGGFIYGVPAAVIFVPYITFGTWDSYRKRIALLISIPLLLALLAGGFMAFYLIQDPSFCPACQYINCVPYAPGLCPEEYSDPNPQVFSL